MASQAQIDANQQNARHSTGPKTKEGKARSSQNAVRHGYNSPTLRIAEDQIDEFRSFRHSLSVDVKARDAVSLTLFDQLVHAGWNLRRIEARQVELLSQSDAFTSDTVQKELQLLLRYHAHFHRVFHRTMKTLKDQITVASTQYAGLSKKWYETLSILADPIRFQKAAEGMEAKLRRSRGGFLSAFA